MIEAAVGSAELHEELVRNRVFILGLYRGFDRIMEEKRKVSQIQWVVQIMLAEQQLKMLFSSTREMVCLSRTNRKPNVLVARGGP